MTKLPFDKLLKMYGDELPEMNSFLQNRAAEHGITPLMLSKYYKVKNIRAAWPEFVRDFNLHASAVASKLKSKEVKKDDDKE